MFTFLPFDLFQQIHCGIYWTWNGVPASVQNIPQRWKQRIQCSNGYRIPLSNTFLLLDTVVALQFEKYWFNHWASSLRSFRISVYNMQTMQEGWGRGGTNWGFVVLNGETRNAVKAIFNHGRICGSACYFESSTQKYIFIFIFLTCRNFSFSCRFQGLDPSERNLWLGVYKAQLTKIAIVVDF